ncbi:MAG: histidine kinase [Sulfurovum sp. AS07-7]|nr:MAG: histidine kinase [Sulfurovum sp. AS07-7]
MIGLSTLKSKINLIFFISFMLLTALFILLFYISKHELEEINKEHEKEVTRYLYSYFLKYGKIDYDFLESQNISVIKDKDEIIKIEHFLKKKNRYAKYGADRYRLKRIIFINNDRFKLLLENKNKRFLPLKTFAVFLMFFIIMIAIYLWIQKSLKPLANLKDKIIKFSQGDLDIECSSQNNDEIAEVANEFNNAVIRIRELLNSRYLMLRTMMHELKTPIAKGRIASEMITDEKQKQRIIGAFDKLNFIIDEFIKIEQITSKHFKPDKKPYLISNLIEAGIDKLLIDNPGDHISLKIIDNDVWNVDFELFALTLKNLIDNGIKYSDTKKIEIEATKEKLIFTNQGLKLKNEIKTYFEPFHESSNSMGLGLYIVKSILDIHDLKFDYEYLNGNNIFTISRI